MRIKILFIALILCFTIGIAYSGDFEDSRKRMMNQHKNYMNRIKRASFKYVLEKHKGNTIVLVLNLRKGSNKLRGRLVKVTDYYVKLIRGRRAYFVNMGTIAYFSANK